MTESHEFCKKALVENGVMMCLSIFRVVVKKIHFWLQIRISSIQDWLRINMKYNNLGIIATTVTTLFLH